MQSTPYEVKRLEYQLRIDAANRCPGAYLDEPAAVDAEEIDELIVSKPPLLQRLASTITVLLRRRAHAEAR
jgi:hypothetical protein